MYVLLIDWLCWFKADINLPDILYGNEEKKSMAIGKILDMVDDYTNLSLELIKESPDAKVISSLLKKLGDDAFKTTMLGNILMDALICISKLLENN